ERRPQLLDHVLILWSRARLSASTTRARRGRHETRGAAAGVEAAYEDSAVVDAVHARVRRVGSVHRHETFGGKDDAVDADGVAIRSDYLAGGIYVPRGGRGAPGHDERDEFSVVDDIRGAAVGGRVVV